MAHSSQTRREAPRTPLRSSRTWGLAASLLALVRGFRAALCPCNLSRGFSCGRGSVNRGVVDGFPVAGHDFATVARRPTVNPENGLATLGQIFSVPALTTGWRVERNGGGEVPQLVPGRLSTSYGRVWAGLIVPLAHSECCLKRTRWRHRDSTPLRGGECTRAVGQHEESSRLTLRSRFVRSVIAAFAMRLMRRTFLGGFMRVNWTMLAGVWGLFVSALPALEVSPSYLTTKTGMSDTLGILRS